MEQPNNKQQSNGNGFILGLVVGVMIALLFTTKKGRAILRDVTEKGIDKLSKLENLKQQVEDSELFDEFEEDEYVKPEPEPEPTPTPKPQPAPEVRTIAKEPEPKESASEKPVAKPTPVKTAAAPAPKPEIKVEEPEPEPEVEEVQEEAKPEEPQEKAPSKVIQGRRWFRGLRKKG